MCHSRLSEGVVNVSWCCVYCITPCLEAQRQLSFLLLLKAFGLREIEIRSARYFYTCVSYSQRVWLFRFYLLLSHQNSPRTWGFVCVVLGVGVISVFDAVAFLACAHRVSSPLIAVHRHGSLRMSSHFATESSVMRERMENFLLPCDNLNLEKFSIPLSCFLSFTSPSRSPLRAYSSSFSLLMCSSSFLTKTLFLLYLEVSTLFPGTPSVTQTDPFNFDAYWRPPSVLLKVSIVCFSSLYFALHRCSTLVKLSSDWLTQRLRAMAEPTDPQEFAVVKAQDAYNAAAATIDDLLDNFPNPTWDSTRMDTWLIDAVTHWSSGDDNWSLAGVVSKEWYKLEYRLIAWVPDLPMDKVAYARTEFNELVERAVRLLFAVPFLAFWPIVFSLIIILMSCLCLFVGRRLNVPRQRLLLLSRVQVLWCLVLERRLRLCCLYFQNLRLLLLHLQKHGLSNLVQQSVCLPCVIQMSGVLFLDSIFWLPALRLLHHRRRIPRRPRKQSPNCQLIRLLEPSNKQLEGRWSLCLSPLDLPTSISLLTWLRRSTRGLAKLSA